MSKQIFSTTDAAKLLGTTPRAVRELLESKQLRGYRIPSSGSWRVQRDDLSKYMSDNGIEIPNIWSACMTQNDVACLPVPTTESRVPPSYRPVYVRWVNKSFRDRNNKIVEEPCETVGFAVGASDGTLHVHLTQCPKRRYRLYIEHIQWKDITEIRWLAEATAPPAGKCGQCGGGLCDGDPCVCDEEAGRMFRL